MQKNETSQNPSSTDDQVLFELFSRKIKHGYKIFLHDHSAKRVLNQQWMKGKKTEEKFKTASSKKIHLFSGDEFTVRHAGWYSVWKTYDDGTTALAAIKIKKSRVWIILIPLLIGLAAGGYAWLHNHGTSAVQSVSSSQSSHPDSTGSADNGQMKTDSSQKAPRNRVIVSSAIIASSGAAGTEATWYFKNPTTDKNGNANNVIEQAKVYVDNQLVAESPALKPGENITKIKLLKDVPTGVTTTKTVVNLFDNDSNEDFIVESIFPVKIDVT